MKKTTITTPENIELEYELAGLGSRFVGAAIDYLIQGFLIALLILVLVFSYPDITSQSPFEIFRSTFAAGVILLIFLILFGYFIFFETLWSGKTPGKKVAQIQVVRDTGQPIGFFDSLLRNLFRIVDFLPFYYIAGAVMITINPQFKRIGDIVAHTIVVRSKPTEKIATLPKIEVRTYLDVDISKMTPEEYNLARDFIIRRNTLNPEDRARIAGKISSLLLEKMDLTEKDIDNEEFLEVCAVEYRKRKKFL